jgi:ubiquinone/menaquinone biosynthesis C-methylase UbiE
LLFALLVCRHARPQDEPPAAEDAEAPVESGPAESEEDEEIPPPLVEYKGRTIAPYMSYAHASWLMRPERQKEEDCEQLLKVLEFEEGAAVCDMGCGNGFYTLPFAKQVGETGKVYAVDIQPEMLELLNDRVKEAKLTNIVPVLGTIVNPKLPDGALDAIVLIDVYHEFSHPEQMLARMRAALKPKGRLILVEFRLEDESVPIRLEHKMSKKQILKELRPNGFKLVEQYNKLPWQHVMFFEPVPPKKPSAARGGKAPKPSDNRDQLDHAEPLEDVVENDKDAESPRQE